MKYTYFVQSGNYKQSDSNGMNGFAYCIGCAKNKHFRGRQLFGVVEKNNLSGVERWSIEDRFATSFKLELIMKNKYDDIPF